MSNTVYRIGLIGLGNMGEGYLTTLKDDPRWEVAWACDVRQERLAWAQEQVKGIKTTTHTAEIISDPTVDVVGLFTLADIRPGLMREAISEGKHIMAEKPIAASISEERALLKEIEASDLIVAVNLFNRNAWYHDQIQAFIASGQIGELGIVSLSHQTAGAMPTEGHAPEGPPFHDCGMHYVDVARWYADSEYDRWHAQGQRMWDWKDPWWVNAHGNFKNGVAFTITQGFSYGQLAESTTCHCGLEAIGTLGVVRMQHDFKTVTIEYHGVNETRTVTGPYGGKKLDVMAQRMAESLDAGKPIGLPTARDSVIASEVSQAMLDAATVDAPRAGTKDEMLRILKHRQAKKSPGA